MRKTLGGIFTRKSIKYNIFNVRTVPTLKFIENFNPAASSNELRVRYNHLIFEYATPELHLAVATPFHFLIRRNIGSKYKVTSGT